MTNSGAEVIEIAILGWLFAGLLAWGFMWRRRSRWWEERADYWCQTYRQERETVHRVLHTAEQRAQREKKPETEGE